MSWIISLHNIGITGSQGYIVHFEYYRYTEQETNLVHVNQFEHHSSPMLVVRPNLLYNAFVVDKSLSSDAQTPIIIGLDSLSTGISRVAHFNILKWLNYLLNYTNQVWLLLDNNNFSLLAPLTPYQNNGYGCGLFCMKYVQFSYANT